MIVPTQLFIDNNDFQSGYREPDKVGWVQADPIGVVRDHSPSKGMLAVFAWQYCDDNAYSYPTSGRRLWDACNGVRQENVV
jgi:hypothetical protein